MKNALKRLIARLIVASQKRRTIPRHGATWRYMQRRNANFFGVKKRTGVTDLDWDYMKQVYAIDKPSFAGLV